MRSHPSFLKDLCIFLCYRSFIIKFILIDLAMTDLLIVTSETDNHVNVVILDIVREMSVGKLSLEANDIVP